MLEMLISSSSPVVFTYFTEELRETLVLSVMLNKLCLLRMDTVEKFLTGQNAKHTSPLLAGCEL